MCFGRLDPFLKNIATLGALIFIDRHGEELRPKAEADESGRFSKAKPKEHMPDRALAGELQATGLAARYPENQNAPDPKPSSFRVRPQDYMACMRPEKRMKYRQAGLSASLLSILLSHIGASPLSLKGGKAKDLQI